jgi:threonine/homoserine/homoserine lactone efflux protein
MEFISLAFVCGLSAGFSPGPLMTVIVSESIKHGKKEGLKVALAPLITDLPIVTICLLILSRISNLDIILGVISLCGGLYLCYLGYDNITFKGAELTVSDCAPQSLRKGIITNFLSPNPYIFWLSVLGPTLLKAYQVNVIYAVSFIIIFYILLMGGKFTIALISAGSRKFLKSNLFIYVNRIIGCLLLLFAVIFIRNAWTYFVN